MLSYNYNIKKKNKNKKQKQKSKKKKERQKAKKQKSKIQNPRCFISLDEDAADEDVEEMKDDNDGNL